MACQNIDKTLTDTSPLYTSIAKNHSFVNDYGQWIRVIDNRIEVAIYKNAIREISKMIPEKNRAEISTYIASRKAESSYLDYVYIPDQKIYGGKYREKGTMYFEVLKYSSLLERAKIRNSVMIDKILGNYDC